MPAVAPALASSALASSALASPAVDELTESQRALLRDLLHPDMPLTDDDRAQVSQLLGEDLASAPPSAKRSRSEQSRINGAKSRGPVTAFGKQIASMNGIIHGLRSRPGLLPDEDRDAFDTFIADVIAELLPATALQQQLARRVAELSWRLSRVPSIEADLLCRMAEGTGVPLMGDRGVDALLSDAIGVEKDNALLRIQRYATNIERSMRASLRELRELQALREGVQTSVKRNDAQPFGDAVVSRQNAASSPQDAASSPPKPAASGGKPAVVASEAMRFSGSFGAAATMAMPVTALPASLNRPEVPAITAEAAVVAISGSLGKNARKAQQTMQVRNEILPHLAGI